MTVSKLKDFSDAILDVCKSYYTDVDALAAERDLWRWRSEEIVKALEQNAEEECFCAQDKRVFTCEACRLHARALEIMAATPKGEE